MRAGWLLAAGGSIMILMFPVSGRLADTLPPNMLISTGLFLFGFGFMLIHGVDVNTGFFTMAALTALTRIGLSAVITPLNATSLRYVPPEKLASASSNANFFRQLGGGMGIAILVAVLETRITFHASGLTATQTPSNPLSSQTLYSLTELLARTGIPEAVRQAMAADHLGRIVYANASMFGFQDVFLVLALITLSALIPAYFLRKPRPAIPVQISAPAAKPAEKPPEAEPPPEEEPPPLPEPPRADTPAYRLLHRRVSQRTPPSDAVAPATRRKLR
jgi:MFS family permease